MIGRPYSKLSAWLLPAMILAIGIAASNPAGADPASEAIFARARKSSAALRSLKAKIRMTLDIGKRTGAVDGEIELLRPNYGSSGWAGTRARMHASEPPRESPRSCSISTRSWPCTRESRGA